MKTKHTWLTFILRLALILTIAQILGSTQALARDEFADRAMMAAPAAPRSITLDMVGHLGGNNGGVFVQGNYAYATFNRELAVLNISDPTHLTRVGYVALPGFAHDVHVVNGYAYATNYFTIGGDLVVVNVSDPTRPVVVGSVNAQIYNSRSVHVAGNYAYLVGDGGGLAVINISNPANPTEVGFNSSLESANDVFVVGNYAYLAAKTGLKVVDVSNPASMTLAGTLTLPGTPRGIYVGGGYAYVTSYIHNDFNAHTFHVVDISNPTNPTQVGSVGVFLYPGETNGVYVSGNYAYVAGVRYGVSGYAGGVQVVDISNPSAPTNVKHYTTSTLQQTYRVHVSGGYAFLTGYTGGLLVVNVSNPSNPTPASIYRMPTDARTLAISGNPSTSSGQAYAYVADGSQGVKVVNVSDPAFPFVTSSMWGRGVSEDIAVSGQYLYVADWGLYVLDISNPASLMFVTRYLPPGENISFNRVHVSGNPSSFDSRSGGSGQAYAYLIDMYSKLWIVNVANPAAPTVAGSVRDAAYSFLDVYVAGNYAYLVGSGGLWVFNVSNPAQPTQVGYSAGSIYRVYVAGNYAYVVGSEFRVVDVSNPASPVVVGTYTLQEGGQGVYVSGNYAYVATCNSGLLVLDVSNPANPTKVGEYNTLGCAKDVRVAGNYIYLADSDNGLVILTPTALQVSPTAVTWMAQVGGANLPARTVNVGSTGTAVAWTAALNPAVGWLNAAPLSGTSPTNIALTANIAGLAVGQYQTQLVIQASEQVQGSPQTIPVTLIVVEHLYEIQLPLIVR